MHKSDKGQRYSQHSCILSPLLLNLYFNVSVVIVKSIGQYMLCDQKLCFISLHNYEKIKANVFHHQVHAKDLNFNCHTVNLCKTGAFCNNFDLI